MTQQEQFEADYLAAFPKATFGKDSCGRYTNNVTHWAQKVWLQQRKRHEAEKAELVTTLKENHQHHIDCDDHHVYKDSAFCEMNVSVISKYEVKS